MAKQGIVAIPLQISLAVGGYTGERAISTPMPLDKNPSREISEEFGHISVSNPFKCVYLCTNTPMGLFVERFQGNLLIFIFAFINAPEPTHANSTAWTQFGCNTSDEERLRCDWRL